MINIVSAKEWAIEAARNWLKMSPVFVDTETTGIGVDDEICDLAVVNTDGGVLLNEMIKPTKPIPPEASAVHHINNEDVASALSLVGHWYKLKSILAERIVAAYNADYDLRMLYQSLGKNNIQNGISWLAVVDIMQLYSAFRGEINPKTGLHRWHKLGVAAEQCGIQHDLALHRALADAELARQVLFYIASGGKNEK